MNIEIDSIVAQKQDIVARQLNDEFILVPIHSTSENVSCLFNLNSVGTDIWQLLDGKKSVGDIIQRLAALYNADINTIESEVLGFLDELLLAEIVVIK